MSHAARGAERGACGSPSSWSSASPPHPRPAQHGLPSLTLVYSLVSGLTEDPEVGPRRSLQLEGLPNQPPPSPPSGGQLLRIPRSVALLGPCLIQSLESVQSQGKEQKEKPLVKAVFSGVCT